MKKQIRTHACVCTDMCQVICVDPAPMGKQEIVMDRGFHHSRIAEKIHTTAPQAGRPARAQMGP